MANLIGKKIKDRYEILESIGRGGMAEVYKVWDAQRGVHLAMKMLREDLAEDRVFLRRFEREAQNLARMQHPHIVRFYGLEQQGRQAFILMDYIDGSTLRGDIFDAHAPLSLDQVLQVFQPVCSALQYAHKQGIIHCDLKSANIMRDQSGKVYLTDFGIARMSDAATSTLVGVGTPAYMAPELVRGEDPTVQTDIYALGVILFEMLSGGERPFIGEQSQVTGTTAEKVRWEQVNLEVPSIKTHNPSVSPELDQIIATCLVKDPKSRFQDASSLTKALAELKEKKKVQKEAPERQEKIESSQVKALQKVIQPQEKVVKPYSSKPEEPETSHDKTGSYNGFWFGMGSLVVIALLAWAIGSAVETAKPITREAPTATADTLSSGSSAAVQISAKDGMTLVYVPEGEFEMGSEDGDDDEHPQHSVYLDAYWIDQTEVTNDQYRTCVQADACGQPNGKDYYTDSNYSDHPVVNVNWNDAQNYCEWAGRRLPTEAEWEKAARGTDGRTYPWGEGINCSKANYVDCNAFPGTSLVGYYRNAGASPYSVYDMAGNVWEWVADWYDSDYYGGSPNENPTGPGAGTSRVLRGGSWDGSEGNMRSAYRNSNDPTITRSGIGFRCAVSP